MDDLIDPPGRNVKLLGQLVLAHIERLEELFQQDLAGIYRRHDRVRGHCLLLVIIDYLDVLRPGVRPVEADPPLPVYPDAVLPAAVARQLLQTITWRDEEVRHGLRGVEHRK